MVSHIAYDCQVTVTNDSPERVTNESCLPRLNHKLEWVMSHANGSGISHVSHEWITNESCRTRTSQEWVVFHTILSVRGGVGCSCMSEVCVICDVFTCCSGATWLAYVSESSAVFSGETCCSMCVVMMQFVLQCVLQCALHCVLLYCVLQCAHLPHSPATHHALERARISLSFSRVQGHPRT